MRAKTEIQIKLCNLRKEAELLRENWGRKGNKGYAIPSIAEKISTLEWVLGERKVV